MGALTLSLVSTFTKVGAVFGAGLGSPDGTAQWNGYDR